MQVFLDISLSQNLSDTLYLICCIHQSSVVIHSMNHLFNIAHALLAEFLSAVIVFVWASNYQESVFDVFHQVIPIRGMMFMVSRCNRAPMDIHHVIIQFEPKDSGHESRCPLQVGQFNHVIESFQVFDAMIDVHFGACDVFNDWV